MALTQDFEFEWYEIKRREGTFHYQFWVIEQEEALTYVKGSQLIDVKKAPVAGGYVTDSSLKDIGQQGNRRVEIIGWVPSRIGSISDRVDGQYYTFHYNLLKAASKASFARGQVLRNQANDGTITNGIILEMTYESDPQSAWDLVSILGRVPRWR